MEAAAAGLPLSPSLELEFDLLKRIKLKIIGCSGGEVERKAGNDESSDGGGSNIRLIEICLFLNCDLSPVTHVKEERISILQNILSVGNM